MILCVIIACEIGFWVFFGAGLASRYLLNLRKLGAVLLVCVPLVDVILLAATIIDLRGGATANSAHGLAAVYLGFSVVFGHSVIRWADERFAHRFAGGSPPESKPKYGRERIIREWKEFGKAFLAWFISCGLLAGAVVFVSDPATTEVSVSWMQILSVILVVWFVFWPLGCTIFPPKPKTELEGR